MKIRSIPSPPKGAPVSKSGAMESVASGGNAAEWDGDAVRRRRKRIEGRRLKQTLIGTFVIGLVALVALGGLVYFGLSRDRVTIEEEVPSASRDLYVPTAQKVMPLSEEKALDLVDRVLKCRTAEQLGGIARLKDITVTEALEFLTTLEQKHGKISRMDWIGNMNTNDIQIEGVQISFADEFSKPLRALLTPDGQGTWQVDLGSLAAKNSVAWEKVISESTIQADLRVAITRDNYYNGIFSSESEWMAYAMACPESDLILIGYCPRKSELNRVLTTALKEQRQIRAIIRVRKTNLPSSRQCEIVSVLAEDWILTDVPLEKRRQDDDAASGTKPESP